MDKKPLPQPSVPSPGFPSDTQEYEKRPKKYQRHKDKGTFRLMSYQVSPSLRKPCRGLLIAHGYVNSIPCKVLIDNGSEGVVLSERFVKEQNIPTRISNCEASMANGCIQELKETVEPVKVSFRN